MGSPDRQLAELRSRTGDRTLSATTGGDAGLTALVILLTLVLAWIATYLAGGSETALPHAFYVPLIIAAIRFRAGGAFLVAILATVAAGPLMPLDVAAGTTQGAANWLTRGGIFIVIGQVTAYLVQHSLASIRSEIGGRLLRRTLSEAIERGQLRLDYQPIIDLDAGGISGVEALVRWDHPERGLVSPDEFIPHAEQSGCIGLITRWVVREAVEQAAAWRDAGALDARFTFSVNLSARDLADRGLCDHIGSVLEEFDVPPPWLHLEITETALMEDVDASISGLDALRSLGVRLVIDDFGAGESSLGQLGRLTVDVVKIDRSFLHEVEHQPHGADLIAGVVRLARSMGVTAVAEGVETPAHAAIISRSGCGLAQGFLFSRPVPAGDVQTLLQDDQAFSRRHLGRLGVPSRGPAPPSGRPAASWSER